MASTLESILPGVAAGQPGEEVRELTPEEREASLLGHYDDFTASSMAIPAWNPSAFINTRGWQTLEDMLSMGPVRSSLNIIRDAVLYKGWRIVPAVNDKASVEYEQAATMADALSYSLGNITDQYGNHQDFRMVIWELMHAIHTGFRITEIHWRVLEDEGLYSGMNGFSSFAAKPCKQIGFRVDPSTMAPVSIIGQTMTRGYTGAPIEKVLRYTYAPSDGLPHGNGIGRVVYKHSWSLDFLYKFWNIALELFGTPFIMAKAPETAIGLARKILKEIRQGAPGVLPDDVEAELLEMKGGGAAAFKAAAEHHTSQIHTNYLYAALTSGEGQRVGSMALGKVHENTQEYGLGGRRADLESIIANQLIRRWVIFNYGREALPLAPRFQLGSWDESDFARLSTGFTQLVDRKIMHPAEPQIRERMGLDPLDPELVEQMQRVWDAEGAPPSTIPGPTPTDPDPEDDDEENDDEEDD
jgi:hypothetical protein